MFERLHLMWVVNLRKSSTYLHLHGFLKLLVFPLQYGHNLTPLLCHFPRKICLFQNKLFVALKIKRLHATWKKPAMISDWFRFHSRMVRTKVTLRVGQGKWPQVGEHPPQDELRRRREEAGSLEVAGKLPRSLPTCQIVQMVVELGTLWSRPTVGGKDPTRISWRKEGSRDPKGTSWGQWLSVRSPGIRWALSSSSVNAPLWVLFMN